MGTKIQSVVFFSQQKRLNQPCPIHQEKCALSAR